MTSPNWSIPSGNDWARSGGLFDPDRARDELKGLESRLAVPGAWDLPAEAQKLSRRLEQVRKGLDEYARMEKRLEDLHGFLRMLDDSPDPALTAECRREAADLEHQLDRLETAYFMQGEYDSRAAFLAIRPGAGGTEAQDWASMLLRMYLRWAETRGFKAEVLDMAEADEAGIKGATVLVDAPYAYGLLQAEKGVHRLVRISPFDANKRRHTSFAEVEIMPKLDEEIKVTIRDEDLRIDTFRASGAGGQLVNKVSSAVRITHLPTNTVVQCQSERSQHQNKASAMAVLHGKLFELERERQEEKLDKIRGERRAVEFGSQIRSYVFMPYTQVKDLRTGLELHDVPAVMDGGIDPLIMAWLRQRAAAKGSGKA